MRDVRSGQLESARAAYQQRDWSQAYALFTAERAHGTLQADDLATLADAAWWLGRTDECLGLFEEAYRGHLHGARMPQAARLALDIGFLCYLRGDVTVGSGWLSRARRLLADEPECPTHGLLGSLEIDEALAAGDHDSAVARARQVRAIGERFADPDTTALGLVGEGIARVKQGHVREGLAILDEAMLPVKAGEVSPGWAGNIYCRIMELCHEIADLRRARQWTDATERWCAGFPSAVMFAGICRVHRAQLLQVRGDWPRAEQEALWVCRDLATMNLSAVAEAQYQLAELRRMRDDLPGAEQAYRRAHELGRDPQPGLALLRLAQQRADAAAASIAAALTSQTGDRLARARLRAAQAEIALSAGDPETAAAAADELDEVAHTYRSPGLEASAAQARGTALLVQGRPAEALPALREACRRWRELDATHLAARVRTLVARACLELDDADAAAMELDAATEVFEALGASADLRAVDRLRGPAPLPNGLTAREAEVLALAADGRSNREIASTLVISDKTVARHLSNIFTKIGASSRTEAAAFAFEHHLHRSRPA
jgi:DNA-binding NarL/FixJ family response regulator